MRVCLYVRVSTIDRCPVCRRLGERKVGTLITCRVCKLDFQGKGQDTENQVSELRRHAATQGWEVVKEYTDHKSAKSGERDQFKEMFDAAERHEFDAVVVWALDRFSREGIRETFNYIDRLVKAGCQFISFTEEHFRTTGPHGEIIMALSAWIAKQERVRISERTKAGLAIARSRGRIGGRKPKDKDVERIRELRAGGMSLVQVAALTGVSRATVDRVCKKSNTQI